MDDNNNTLLTADLARWFSEISRQGSANPFSRSLAEEHNTLQFLASQLSRVPYQSADNSHGGDDASQMENNVALLRRLKLAYESRSWEQYNQLLAAAASAWHFGTPLFDVSSCEQSSGAVGQSSNGGAQSSSARTMGVLSSLGASTTRGPTLHHQIEEAINHLSRAHGFRPGELIQHPQMATSAILQNVGRVTLEILRSNSEGATDFAVRRAHPSQSGSQAFASQGIPLFPESQETALPFSTDNDTAPADSRPDTAGDFVIRRTNNHNDDDDDAASFGQPTPAERPVANTLPPPAAQMPKIMPPLAVATGEDLLSLKEVHQVFLGKGADTPPRSPTHPLSRSSSFGQIAQAPFLLRNRATEWKQGKHWILCNKYLIKCRLGRGSQGVVWRAMDITCEEDFAIKVLPRGELNASRYRTTMSTSSDSNAASSMQILKYLNASDRESGSGGAASSDGNDAHFIPIRSTFTAQQPTAAAESPTARSAVAAANSGRSTPTSAPAIPARSFKDTMVNVMEQRSWRQSPAQAAVQRTEPQSSEVNLFEASCLHDTVLPANIAIEIAIGLTNHPNILRIREVIDDPLCDYIFLVMPLVEGPPCRLLATGVTDKGPLPAPTVLRYLHGVGSALGLLHAANIIHCDIKIENLMRSGDQLLLADFGLTQLDGGMRVLGGGRGTYAYWAPEIFEASAANQNRVQLTPQSDCYALGICAFVMAFGQFPYWVDVSHLQETRAWHAALKRTEIRVPPSQSAWRNTALGESFLDAPKSPAETHLNTVVSGLLTWNPARRWTMQRLVDFLRRDAFTGQ